MPLGTFPPVVWGAKSKRWMLLLLRQKDALSFSLDENLITLHMATTLTTVEMEPPVAATAKHTLGAFPTKLVGVGSLVISKTMASKTTCPDPCSKNRMHPNLYVLKILVMSSFSDVMFSISLKFQFV